MSSQNKSPIKLALLGATGRMGQAIQTAALAQSDKFVVSALPTRDLTADQLAHAIADVDVVVDFSMPAALDKNLSVATTAQKPYVCGITGLDQAHKGALSASAEQIPVLYSANMSPGINMMLAVLAQMTRGLGDEYDISIDDLHHFHKKDAPSGTAIILADEISKTRPNWNQDIRSRREGEAPGQHTISFSGLAETLMFRHTAKDRSVFAEGALLAAKWIAGKPAGQYAMKDVFSDS